MVEWVSADGTVVPLPFNPVSGLATEVHITDGQGAVLVVQPMERPYYEVPAPSQAPDLGDVLDKVQRP